MDGEPSVNYWGEPICGDCRANAEKFLLFGEHVTPLDARIAEARKQEPVEEHAFERPGFEWP